MNNSKHNTVIFLGFCILLAFVTAKGIYSIFSYTALLPVNNPSEDQIEAYGRSKFIQQALEFKPTEKANTELLNTFNFQRIEHYGDGVLLVFAENKKYVKGLYVDPKDTFDEVSGSGVSIIPRSKHIGVVEIKKRIIVGTDIKGLGVAHSIYSNDSDKNEDVTVHDPNKM